MKQRLFFCVFAAVVMSISFNLSAQVGINTDGSLPDPSAGLDVKFINKGFLPPRMTFEQRNSIPDPAEGLIVICTNCSNAGSPVISVFLAGKWLFHFSSVINCIFMLKVNYYTPIEQPLYTHYTSTEQPLYNH